MLSGNSFDDPLPSSTLQEWSKFANQFTSLSSIQIPRRLYFPGATLRLIGFSDGSQVGYGACVYLHVSQPDQPGCCFLLRAKSKVAPLKTWTIPRLELAGSLLLAQLAFSVQQNSPFKFQQTILFTDSTIVLSWIKSPPHLYKIFVPNRITQILELTDPSQWRHVASEDNPADSISRGLFPQDLVHHHLYWNGPRFTSLPLHDWKATLDLDVLDNEQLPEMKSNKMTCLSATSTDNNVLIYLSKFSSLDKLLRVLSYLRRFVHNARRLKPCLKGPLSLKETNDSLDLFTFLTQQHYFRNEIMLLKQGKSLNHSFEKFSPFIDSFGLVRAGGRLKNSSLSYSAKHPILLPKGCHLSTLLCTYYHQVSCHSGPSTVQALIQRKWWIFSIRSLLRLIIFRCLKCYRLKSKPVQPFMADLPAQRSQISRAFSHVGTDFCGPFRIKQSNRRNASYNKGYLCIFVCMATKAAHLEMVSQLSTEAFIACFERFVARRGLPSCVYSDLGTNYVGASRELKDFQSWLGAHHEEIHSTFVTQQINWKFNPPQAPNFGGLWEACVKSAKTLLYRLIGDASLTFEEFATVFSRIEAALNSRPLCALQLTPDDGTDYLSPGHFLIGAPLLSLPEIPLPENVDLCVRWQRLRQIVQSFWKRWSNEYLQTQLQRSKWSTQSPPLQVGQLVYISGLNTSPLAWPLGRIIQIHPGPDGIVRVATVKTSNSTFTRPVNKLVPLPIHENTN